MSEPSTALAVIDTMADDLLFTPGAVTDAQLAAGRDWYLTEAKKYDIATEKARTEFLNEVNGASPASPQSPPRRPPLGRVARLAGNDVVVAPVSLQQCFERA